LGTNATQGMNYTAPENDVLPIIARNICKARREYA